MKKNQPIILSVAIYVASYFIASCQEHNYSCALDSYELLNGYSTYYYDFAYKQSHNNMYCTVCMKSFEGEMFHGYTT